MRLLHSISLVLTLALAGCAASLPPAPPPPAAAPAAAVGAAPAAPPPPAPPPLGPDRSVRGSEITAERPTPRLGFGLYLYILPERQISEKMQAALLKFHGCLNRPRPSDSPQGVALMLMPIRRTPAGDRVDTALAHDFLRKLPIKESNSRNEVWIVASNKPLSLNAPTAGVTPIPLSRIAPAYISDWLFLFQDNIEKGTVAAPSDWLLRIKSAGLIGGIIGREVFGIKAAIGAGNACAVEP
jgi:hypothetical protein